jgi:hypothetical protein
MTIIGLPYDTEASIMRMADWVTTVSKYQTANLLTPLPATSNWEGLTPLDENGEILRKGAMRPYHLYTGRQLVHLDERWGLRESADLFERYHSRLNPVDTLYARMFRMLRAAHSRPALAGRDSNGAISARISEFCEVLSTISDSSRELPEAISLHLHEVSENLKRYRLQLSSTGKELPDVISTRIGEAGEALRRCRLHLANTGREVSDTLAARINEVNEVLTSLSSLSGKQVQSYG